MFSIFRKLFGSDDDRERAKAPGQRDRLAANSPSHASEPFRPGSVIHGKYEVVRKLGEGGFGVVVLAKMRPDNTLIALKIARPDLEFPTEVRQRFKKEASIWINLDNPPIF